MVPVTLMTPLYPLVWAPPPSLLGVRHDWATFTGSLLVYCPEIFSQGSAHPESTKSNSPSFSYSSSECIVIKNKTASYFTSIMGWFENSRGIAIRTMKFWWKYRWAEWQTSKQAAREKGRSWEELFWMQVRWRKARVGDGRSFPQAGLVVGHGELFLLGSVTDLLLFVNDLKWQCRRLSILAFWFHFKWDFLYSVSHVVMKSLYIMLGRQREYLYLPRGC